MRAKAYVFVLSLTASNLALAGSVYDDFYAKAYDLSNADAMAFTEAYVNGTDPLLGYVYRITELEGVGESAASAGSAIAISQAQYGQLRGYSSTGAVSDEAHFENGWRDVLTVTGGTGTGTLQVNGHADGRMTGRQSYFAVSTVVQNAGGSVLAGNSFSNLYDEITDLGNCPASLCTVTITGSLARVDFSVSIDFQYGAPNVLVATTGGFASTGSDGTASLVNFLSTSSIDSIVAPLGSTLNSASGPLVFEGGQWHYAVSTVPEPSSYALLLVGIAGVLCRASRAVVGGGRRSARAEA